MLAIGGQEILSHGFDRLRSRRNLLAYIAIGILIYLSYYLFSYDFGLYSDDAFTFRRTINFSPMWYDLTHGYNWNPRHLGLSLHRIVSYLSQLSGVGYGMYFASWILLVMQACIAFVVMKKYFSSQIAFIAVAFFMLFPADASKYMPVHAFWTQFSAVTFWLALMLFSRDRLLGAAMVASLIVFIYETHLVAAAAIVLLPLLKNRFTFDQYAGRMATYAIYLVGCIAGAVFIRSFLPPGRLSGLMDLSVDQFANRLVSAAEQGVRASSNAMLDLPNTFLENLNTASTLTALVALILVGGVAWIYSTSHNENEPQLTQTLIADAGLMPKLVHILLLLVFGVVVYTGSYLIYVAERYPPIHIVSRLSNVHMAAGIGVAFILAALLELIRCLFRNGLMRYVQYSLLGLCVVYIAMASGYFVQYQERLIANWQYQVSFWENFDHLVPDLEENTLVLVENTIEENKKFEDPALSWAFNISLPLMRVVPTEWKAPPVVLKDYTAKYTGVDGALFVTAHTVPKTRVDRVIVLGFDNGVLYRKQGTHTIEGRTYDLTIGPSSNCCLQPGIMLEFLE